jgi:hypothetical protein
MTPRHIDTRPLSEKLEEHVEPTVNTTDISDGNAFKIRGTGQDIALLQQACKEALRRIEAEGISTDVTYIVSVPKREVTT